MNEDLIGEAVTLETSGDPESVTLVVGLIRDLLAAAEAQPDDLTAVESELRTALEELRQEADGALARITTEVVLVTAGLEIRLQAASPSMPARTVLCPA